MSVEIQARASRNLLVLTGQVGLDATVQLHEQAELLAAGAGDVDVDWSKADGVTAGSLQVLLALEIALAGQGRALRVTGDDEKVRGWLELAGLSSRFPIAEPAA